MNNKRLVTWKTDWHKHIEKTPDQINKINIKWKNQKTNQLKIEHFIWNQICFSKIFFVADQKSSNKKFKKKTTNKLKYS